eukprot:TRINITY_DN5099_c0_g1_i1.p1 TRINITY_DN5099_c0_g1~~TRINITY_DN5099_c0_g1_i1.p1  ORF type:complete len:201 (+),score=38.18 TRINITY_DN5099_c0_g1_i1:94-696(+)
MTSFHFSTTTPSPQLFEDIGHLTKLSVSVLQPYLVFVFQFLNDQEVEKLFENIRTFAQEQKINHQILKNASRGLLIFFRESLKANSSPVQVRGDLLAFGLDDEKSDLIAKKWKSNFLSISSSVVGNTLMVNQLVDLEWRFGVTTSNKDVYKVGTTFLQLKLVLDKGDNKTFTEPLELSLPQFYQFLSEMEKAKASLDLFA